MTMSYAVQQIHQVGTTGGRKREAGQRTTRNVPGTTIPPRYRDGRGGIAVEQIHHDRREARRQVVRAFMRRLGALWC